ncbi:MarR family winged helix-turn-helix transcriptional regulator [Kurthia senegalensis]|uniref:MarR family winged helix-turn-helix transcriptional regulator n=1 Tax=Kurthia senegalensis TaxID=1033740 RepID=UPI000288EA46|nr:MarR family transcriptional regulator [Kurthia senegalensis]
MSENLDHQLCFLLYVSSKEIIKEYTARLKKYDLTYTGYITILALCDEEHLTIKQLGHKLFLDSGTLTPLVKRLESNGYVNRKRSKEDERHLFVSLTPKGRALSENLHCIGEDILQNSSIQIQPEKVKELHAMLSQFINQLR